MAISRRWWGARGTVPRDPVRKRRLAVHHTVSANRSWTKAQERSHMREIEASHRNQGWATVGYSWVLFPSGRLYVGRGLTGLPAAQGGANSGSWAVSLVGNFEFAYPTRKARLRLNALVLALKLRRGLRYIGGHSDFPNQATACPGRRVVPVVNRIAKRYKLVRL